MKKIPIAHEELVQFLSAIDDDFNPKISESRPINEYAQKLLTLSNIEFARDEQGILSSIVAYYLNHDTGISYISVAGTSKDKRRKGLSRKLMSQCIENSRDSRIKILRLVVSKRNFVALSFYTSLGFKKSSELVHKNLEKMYLDLEF